MGIVRIFIYKREREISSKLPKVILSSFKRYKKYSDFSFKEKLLLDIKIILEIIFN
jgi:hypothetical protein